MDAITDFFSGTMFWRILLFVHFLMGVALLAAVTLQTTGVLIPVRKMAVHRSLAPHTTGLPGHPDDPPLSAELPSGRLDLHEIPHVRANPDGAVWLLVDAWLI